MSNKDVSMIALQGLVKGLNDTFWCDLQSTALFAEHLRGAEAVIAAERIRDAAPDLLDALQHIVEYWNRDQNEGAMADALWHIIDTASEAIAKARGES